MIIIKMGSRSRWAKDEPVKRSASVFAWDLPYKLNEYSLRDMFSQFGEIEQVNLQKNKKAKSDRLKCYGCIQFKTLEAAKEAVNAPQSKLKVYGRTISVSVKYSRCENVKKGVNDDLNTISCSDPVLKNKSKSLSNATINNLTEDALILVFSQLSMVERIGIERVCKRWRACSIFASRTATRDGTFCLRKHFALGQLYSLLGGITWSSFISGIEESKLSQILYRICSQVKRLDITSANCVNLALPIIAEQCPNLEDLQVPNMCVKNSGLLELAKHCLNLKKLNASMNYLLTDSGIEQFFDQCKSLLSIDLSKNSKIEGKCLERVSEDMEVLILNQCRKLTNKGLEILAERCTKLQTLDIGECVTKCSLTGCKRLDQKSISDVIKVNPNLTEFNMGEALSLMSFSNHPIYSLINPALLTKLEVFNTGLDDRGLWYIGDQCVNLTYLDISSNKLTDDSIYRLSNLKKLETLNACHLSNITDDPLYETLTNKTLKHLRLQSCKDISDNLMFNIAEYCPLIEEVEVSGCPYITVLALEAFYNRKPLKEGRPHLKLFTADNQLYDTKKSGWKNLKCKGVTLILEYKHMYSSNISWKCDSEIEEAILYNTYMEMQRVKRGWSDEFHEQLQRRRLIMRGDPPTDDEDEDEDEDDEEEMPDLYTID